MALTPDILRVFYLGHFLLITGMFIMVSVEVECLTDLHADSYITLMEARSGVFGCRLQISKSVLVHNGVCFSLKGNG